MRIAVLWNGLGGYLNACLRALANIPGNELFVSRQLPQGATPYSDNQFAWIANGYTYEHAPDRVQLLSRLESFRPDVLIVASWNRPEHRYICRRFRGRALRVCCMDNQWLGRPKQWLGRVTAPVFIRRMFEVAFVAGDRQAHFARRLAFPEEMIWHGFLSCDHDRFYAAWQQRLGDAATSRKCSFLYVGRLAPEKALDTLLSAYRLYRSQCSSPWRLVVAGEGPLRNKIEQEPGVDYCGFVQPDDLPDLFARCGCFILPSRWEHWGVAIHEATAAGLPVICTPECGASVHLVQDGYNGLLVAKDNPQALARTMSRMTEMSAEEMLAMSIASARQSLQFTPVRWASYVDRRSREYLRLEMRNALTEQTESQVSQNA